MDRFADKPAELKALLQQHLTTMAVLSSGNLRLIRLEAEDSSIRRTPFKKDRDLHADPDEPPRETLGTDDYKRMGRLLTELGKRMADAGIPLCTTTT